MLHNLQVKYTEEYEQSKGKGSFPAMLTPAYEVAKKANTLASNVSEHSRPFVYVEIVMLFVVTHFSSILHVFILFPGWV